MQTVILVGDHGLNRDGPEEGGAAHATQAVNASLPYVQDALHLGIIAHPRN